VHVIETATGPLLRAVGAGELDMAVAWCPLREPGLRYERLRDEPVMAHVATDHPLARETTVTLARLAQETILVGSGDASRGYTERIEMLFAAAGLSPTTLPDPYPDLGLLAAIEGRAIVLGSPVQAVRERQDLAILDVAPRVTLPFDLVWRDRALPATLAAIIDIARQLRDRSGWLSPAQR
jgi:DNA-binding transcriptional LysR family regulator